MRAPPLNMADPVIRRWWVDVNVTLDDGDAVVRDMLRPPQERELGPAKHREMYEEVWDKLMTLMGRGLPPDEPEGSSPTH